MENNNMELEMNLAKRFAKHANTINSALLVLDELMNDANDHKTIQATCLAAAMSITKLDNKSTRSTFVVASREGARLANKVEKTYRFNYLQNKLEDNSDNQIAFMKTKVNGAINLYKTNTISENELITQLYMVSHLAVVNFK